MNTVKEPGREFDASVVIVNFRTPELVERCLESVRETCEQLELELLVVDNGSHDGSVQRLAAACPDVTIVELSENRGFAAGVNVGFARSHADFVVLLNPDTEVRPAAIESLLGRLLEHPGTGVVAPLLEGPDGRIASNGYRRFPNLLTAALNLSLPIVYALERTPSLHFEAMTVDELLAGGTPAHVMGAALAVRRLAYEQAGPLDEGFFLYLEETEWQGRVARGGWEIEIVPQARVCHLVRGGGCAALVPSPYLVESALRYLSLKGTPRSMSRAALALALSSSWLMLRVISLLPSRRERASFQARAYAALLRTV